MPGMGTAFILQPQTMSHQCNRFELAFLILFLSDFVGIARALNGQTRIPAFAQALAQVPPTCVNLTNPIGLWDGYTGQGISDNGVAYIDQDAHMPALVAAHCTNYSDNVFWNLTIYGDINNLCKTTTITGRTNPWRVPDLPIQGGDAVLAGTDMTPGGLSGSIHFKIVGQQAKIPDVIKYIRSIQGGLWYAEYVARFRKSMAQFDQSGNPVSDGGRYGVMAIPPPGYAPPTCSQLWNWKENVKRGVDILRNMADQAKKWMNCDCKDKGCADWCFQYPAGGQRLQAQKDIGNSTVPSRVEANCVFQDNSTRVVEDAVAFNMYSSNYHHGNNYCWWDNTQKTWGFTNNGYVNDVCSCVVPCQWGWCDCTPV